MMRRSIVRLGAGIPAGRPAPGHWNGEGERPGHKEPSASDLVWAISPFTHMQRLSDIEEEMGDARRCRKFAIMLAILAYPFYFLAFEVAEGFRMPAMQGGSYPAVQWNDEKAGKQ